jgi:hypothetical protein
MKSSLLSAAFALAVVVPAVRLAAADAPPPAVSALQAEFVDSDDAAVAAVRRDGEAAINWIANSLIRELNNALAQGGPDKAIDTCHLKALPTTGAVITQMPQIKAAKRTSLQVRNPANAPDAAEQLALSHVQREIDNGNTPPRFLVQRIDQGGKLEWRVYRPIALMANCVTCHGEPDSLPSGVRATLEVRYPQDKAVGYSVGQWRGLIRVTVTGPSAPATKTPVPKS